MSISANMRRAIKRALEEKLNKSDLVFKMSPDALDTLIMEFGFAAQRASASVNPPQYFDDIKIEVEEAFDGWELYPIG